MPEVTVSFWITKVLCTTVGETAADLLIEKTGLGLTGVSVLMSALPAVVLVIQFRSGSYRPGVYWPAVALISVVTTLVSDNLTDTMGVPLEASTTAFALLLAIVFVVWYRRERILSIRHIDTTGRESFYRSAVLSTFALGTTAGDLVSERIGPGYWLSAVLFAMVIAAVALTHFALDLDALWSFWIAYVLTRRLGASTGDYLSRPVGDGGLGLGAVVTSALFLAVILGPVVHLSFTRRDVSNLSAHRDTSHRSSTSGASGTHGDSQEVFRFQLAPSGTMTDETPDSPVAPGTGSHRRDQERAGGQSARAGSHHFSGTRWGVCRPRKGEPSHG